MLNVGSADCAAKRMQMQEELKMAQARVDRAESLGMEALQQRDTNYQAWECSENVVANLQRAMVLNAEEMAAQFGQGIQQRDAQWMSKREQQEVQLEAMQQRLRAGPATSSRVPPKEPIMVDFYDIYSDVPPIEQLRLMLT